MAAVKRNLTNSQKAQVLIDVLGTIDLSKAVDKSIKDRSYKPHLDKIADFKQELEMIVGGGTEIKSAFGVSFKSMGILQKEQKELERVRQRTRKQMTGMLASLAKGDLETKRGKTKQVVFGATDKTKVVNFAQ